MIASAGVAAAAFVSMEPFTYAAHRWVMHGAGWGWHRAHHQPQRRPVDTNDLFPVVFAALTVTAMTAGTVTPKLRILRPVGAGVTAYGAIYVFVHDLYIHRRLGRLPACAPLEYLGQAHATHHRSGGEPYGMLAPVIRSPRRGRAAPSLRPLRRLLLVMVGQPTREQNQRHADMVRKLLALTKLDTQLLGRRHHTRP